MPARACHTSKLQRDDVIGKFGRTEYRIALMRSLHPLHGIQIAAFLNCEAQACLEDHCDMKASSRELTFQMNWGDRDIWNKENQAMPG